MVIERKINIPIFFSSNISWKTVGSAKKSIWKGFDKTSSKERLVWSFFILYVFFQRFQLECK